MGKTTEGAVWVNTQGTSYNKLAVIRVVVPVHWLTKLTRAHDNELVRETFGRSERTYRRVVVG